jgi:hypothetical protein
LVAGCILEHLLGVVVSLSFQFFVVRLCQGLNLLVKVLVDLFLGRLQLLNLVLGLELVAVELFFKLLDLLFILVGTDLLIDTRVL